MYVTFVTNHCMQKLSCRMLRVMKVSWYLRLFTLLYLVLYSLKSIKQLCVCRNQKCVMFIILCFPNLSVKMKGCSREQHTHKHTHTRARAHTHTQHKKHAGTNAHSLKQFNNDTFFSGGIILFSPGRFAWHHNSITAHLP